MYKVMNLTLQTNMILLTFCFDTKLQSKLLDCIDPNNLNDTYVRTVCESESGFNLQ